MSRRLDLMEWLPQSQEARMKMKASSILRSTYYEGTHIVNDTRATYEIGKGGQ